MESGLKRLWHRQRSKSKSSVTIEPQQTPAYEVHVSGPAPQIGTLPFKPSLQKSTIPQYKHGKTYSDVHEVLPWQDDRRYDPFTLPSGGIKPMLIGISRPSTGESLAHAVANAADAVAEGRPTKQAKPTVNGSVPKARHIDIFQVSARNQFSGVNYNEDVAKRNLDMKRWARGGGSILGHTTPSIYEEDVADRNSSIEIIRGSIDQVRTSKEDSRPSFEARLKKDFTSPRTSNEYPLAAGRSAKHKKATESEKHGTIQQPRLYSEAGKDVTSRLPTIEQEVKEGAQPPAGATAPGSDRGIRDRQSIKPAPDKKATVNSQPTSHPLREVSQITTASVSPNSPAKPSNKANVSRPLQNGGLRGTSSNSVTTLRSLSSMPDYQITTAEGTWDRYYTNMARSRIVNGKLASHDPQNKNSQDSASVNSAVSKTSSLKKAVHLSNRTIMDLSGDDSEIFTDTDGGSSYVESPEVQQAQFGSFYSGQPALIHPIASYPMPSKPAVTREPVENGEPEFFDLTKIQPPMRAQIVAEEIRKRNELAGEIRDDVFDDEDITPRAEQPQITFSKINTLASFSPRSSIADQTGGTLTSDVANVVDQSPAIAIGSTRSMSSSKSSKSTMPKVPLSISVLPPPEDEVRPEVDSPTIPTHATPRTKPPKSKFSRNGKLPPVEEDVPQTAPDSNRVQSTFSSQGMYASPESLQSSDFTHPNRAFGVVTRDFAAIPSSQHDSSDKSSELSNGTAKHITRDGILKAVGGDDDISEPCSPTRYVDSSRTAFQDTGLDEEDFARKQREAKAALLRLQKSLNEDFNLLPACLSLPNGRSTPSSFSEQQPSQVPTSKFTPNHLPEAVTNADATEGPRAAPSKPTPSFYAMVTSPASTPIGSPRNSGPQVNGEKAPLLQQYQHQSQPKQREQLTSIPESTLRLGGRTFFDPHLGENAAVSPGEVSLSSFPLPATSPPHSRQVSSTSSPRPGASSALAGTSERRNSLRSISSGTSAFSIPYHMVPGRSSSMRDHLDTFSLGD